MGISSIEVHAKQLQRGVVTSYEEYLLGVFHVSWSSAEDNHSATVYRVGIAIEEDVGIDLAS